MYYVKFRIRYLVYDLVSGRGGSILSKLLKCRKIEDSDENKERIRLERTDFFVVSDCWNFLSQMFHMRILIWPDQAHFVEICWLEAILIIIILNPIFFLKKNIKIGRTDKIIHCKIIFRFVWIWNMRVALRLGAKF